jgi:hypothetical protein
MRSSGVFFFQTEDNLLAFEIFGIAGQDESGLDFPVPWVV